ncbi:hypothetical protein CGRA01v4_04176 [Colletotrichum graminicola]|nr:hypothetical protein CGRA01v4_04176 [Colletotrichum graminicola]
MSECIDDSLCCSSETFHPLLILNIIMPHLLLSEKNEQVQRNARHWMPSLEHDSASNVLDLRDSSHSNGHSRFDLPTVASDLTECHSQVL